MSAGSIGIVDDDPALLRALRRLLTVEGFAVRTFDSATQLLAALDAADLDCLVVDVTMPGLSGLELQEHLNARDGAPPIVFLTGDGNIPMTVRAIQAGAVNFLTKPVNDTDLIAAVQQGVDLAVRRKARHEKLGQARERLASLTPREFEVMTHVITGRPNKQIAAELGTGEQTIKVHRMRVMEKMGVDSVVELARLAALLKVKPAASR